MNSSLLVGKRDFFTAARACVKIESRVINNAVFVVDSLFDDAKRKAQYNGNSFSI